MYTKGEKVGEFIFIMLISFFIFTNNVFADKIYLKSGKILEGKLKENKRSRPWDDWCVGKNDIVVWNKGRSQCISKSNIEKVEKEFKKPAGIALLAKDNNWGEEGNGYRTQLIPTSSEYVVGQPMTFHLIMKNVSDSIKWYDAQGISHPSFIITGPDGTRVNHKVAPFQTGGGEQPIDTGEIVNLSKERDITKEYIIIKPGRYTIQFSKGNYGMSAADVFPASNIIKFEVQPGQPLPEDTLITSLSGIIPEECRLTKGWGNNPKGRPAIQGVPIGIFCPDIHRMTSETILWLTAKTSDITGAEEQAEHIEISEYLGHNESGHIYLSVSSKLEKLWPSIREDIIKILNLSQ